MPATCALLGIILSVLPAGVQAAEASPSNLALCGCSWSIEKGCSISSRQLVKALNKPALIDKLCAADEERPGGFASQSCLMKEHIRETVKKFRGCIEVEPQAKECMQWQDGAYCQWEAQEDGQCGIDPEKLVAELTNKSKDHPFVKWILMTDVCLDRSAQMCNANVNVNCRWVGKVKTARHSRGLAHCDIDEGEIVAEILMQPRLYQMMHLYMRSAVCLQNREHSPNSCPSPCKSERGECKLPDEGGDTEVVLQLLEATCRGAAESECEHPCEKYLEGEEWKCGGPPMLPDNFHWDRANFISEEDEDIIHVLLALSAATSVYHQQCGTVGTRAECAKLDALCREDTSLQPDPSNHYITTFGLSDTIANMLDKAQNGSLTEHVEKYLEAHPRSGKKALNAVVGDFSRILDEEVFSAVSPTPAPPSIDSDNTRSSLGVVSKAVGAAVILAACLGLAYGRASSPARTAEITGLLANREMDMYRASNDG